MYPWIDKFYHWVSSLSKLEMEIWNKFDAKFSQIVTQNFIAIKVLKYFCIIGQMAGICELELSLKRHQFRIKSELCNYCPRGSQMFLFLFLWGSPKKGCQWKLVPKACRYNMCNQNGQIICIGDDNDSFWNFLNKVFMSRMVGWVDGVISYKFLFKLGTTL